MDDGSLPHCIICCSSEENVPWWLLTTIVLGETIGSSVLVSCTSIGATVRRDISLISSALGPEDTWTKAANSWVFVVKLIGMRGGYLFLKNLSLMVFPADTLKASLDSTNIEFMWRGKKLLSHTSAPTKNSPHCRETLVCHLIHYHWVGR